MPSTDTNHVDFGGAMDALIHLLDAVEETNWIRALRLQKQRWEETGDGSTHQRIYGGAGSFSDVVLCRSNRYRISKAQDLWVPELFDTLQGLCYQLSSGRRRNVRSLVPGSPQLRGWFCRACGYVDVAPSAVERYAASRVLRTMVREGLRRGDLVSIVRQILALDVPKYERELRRTYERVEAARIPVVTREGWLEICAGCSSDDTCLYDWDADRAGRFHPAKNNLSRRGRRSR